jgi:tripartite-type tricarboxylate transporter receptor subunit TctC
MMIATLGSALPHVRAGRLKALASAGERRTLTLPELPTLAESGLPGYSAENWYGLLAPRGTPASRVALLSRRIGEDMRGEEAKEQLMKLGFEPMSSSPAELNAYLQRDIAKWARVIGAAHLQLRASP